MESNISLFEYIFHNMFGNTIARSVPYFHFFSQSVMHDLCVPSIYSTHDFVSNVYSILGKEGTCDIRLFWYWLLCLCSGNIYSSICMLLKGALEGAEPLTCRYESMTAAVSSIVPFEQSTRLHAHKVHINHVLLLQHFDLGNHRKKNNLHNVYCVRLSNLDLHA